MDKILILDFGSQYNQLIARRIREMNVYCELKPFDVTLDFIKEFNPVGIIFSGGPSSVNDEGSPDVDPKIFELGIPILGICYGMQLTSSRLGGKLSSGKSREYGRAYIENLAPDSPFLGLPTPIFIRRKFGVPIEFAIDFRPLCPAKPPPSLNETTPNSVSISS